MSSFIHFIIDQGVPQNTVELILMFPIIATIMVIARQVVGIKAFGVYTPSIVALTFLSLGVKVKYGIFLFILVLLTGTATRLILKQFRLLYLPRVAIMLSVVSVIVLFVLIVGGHFKMTGLASVSVFPLLVLITIVEKFIAVQVEKGFKNAIYLSFETLILAIIAYFIASIEQLREVMLKYPWIIFFIILFNIILGRWTGLRFSEYYRFREVIKKQ